MTSSTFADFVVTGSAPAFLKADARIASLCCSEIFSSFSFSLSLIGGFSGKLTAFVVIVVVIVVVCVSGDVFPWDSRRKSSLKKFD